jgi:putative colanic acid biosynthesis acetyltransferase WcaF
MNNFSVDFSRYDNSWYNPGGFLARLLWYMANAFIFNTAIVWPANIKKVILKLFGARIGHSFTFKPFINIKYPWFLKIGSAKAAGSTVSLK